MRGNVESLIQSKLKSGERLHFSLIDPEKATDLNYLESIASELAKAGTDAFLVGGSAGISETDIDDVVKVLKQFGKPVILFPGNVSGLSRYADAVLFMSLLNSDDPYFIIGAQTLGAPIVARYGLEPLPTAYIIVGYGGAAGYIGRARPIPYDRPEIGLAYALAAEMLGMRYVYLEAGSGAPKPIPPEFIKMVKQGLKKAALLIGGGLRNPEDVKKAVEAGADIIVTGTVIEKNPETAIRIINAIKNK
jgi:phosphoglycerol geranylgeranyltransferase